MLRIGVVGAGISGLAAALRLTDLARENGARYDVTIYEADDRLGGCVHTLHEDGLIVEWGADSLLVDKPWGVRLLQRLGLEDQLVAMLAQYKGARIVHHGQLRKLPEQFRLFSPSSMPALLRSRLFSPAGLARAALEPFIPARRSTEDESLSSFVTRRFGREVLDRLAQPLVGGIYSADPDRLSMEAALPQFLELERAHGSVVRGIGKNAQSRVPPKLMSLRGGLGTLVDALDRELSDVRRVRTRVTSLRELRRTHDRVICAVPAYATAEIVRDADPHLAGMLGAIRYNSIATVNLAYDKTAIPELPRTQGFIVPFVERRNIVAATIASQKYPGRAPDGTALLRAFIGGALQPGLVERPDAELEAIAREEFAVLLGIRASPGFTSVARMRAALPEYGVGHLRLVDEIESRSAAIGVAVAGSAYRGVGIPDCIHSGECAAEQVVKEDSQGNI